MVMRFPNFLSSDKNHNPRKGTETDRSIFSCQGTVTDKNHNPRKGTETTLISRGTYPKFKEIRTIIPARGRKLIPAAHTFQQMTFDKNHNPRKGTETFTIVVHHTDGVLVKIRTIIPARGRARKKQLNHRIFPCWENVDD